MLTRTRSVAAEDARRKHSRPGVKTRRGRRGRERRRRDGDSTVAPSSRAAPPTAGISAAPSRASGLWPSPQLSGPWPPRRLRRRNIRAPPNSNRNQPLISDLLKEGQEILVQIAKEPIGKKGARITSHIALPGRFLVYMPTVNHTGVSRKIASDEERQRLKRIVISERENGHGGFIVRTAAQNASEEELRADIRFLKDLWNDIKNRAESSKPPALIYHDLNVVERVLRDQVTADFSAIWVDTEAGIRARAALRQPLPAGAGEARQALHQRDAAVRAVRHSGRNQQGAASRKSG